ncbi:hypothetical protein [Georgenia sp. H159]|uniref:hypothetical protein n=1 Tax=Georgenia sp. H159 TaxID=3076115 RepID=UPI002D7A404B|nr:hypothetical protein [Georgenia sp. H159]
MHHHIGRAVLAVLATVGLVVTGAGVSASAASTDGSGGPLTDRLDVPFSANGYRSSYHVFASGLDWSRPVGLLVYTDGSGGYGIDNPNHTHLLDADGSAGLVAVARKHNLLLVTPEAPGPSCDGSDNCWYDVVHAAGKARWSSALITHLRSQYDLDLDRVVVGGYSSGAQWTTRFFLPAHGEAHSVDLAVAIAYGGAPVSSPSFSAAYRAATVVSFDTGTADEAYTSNVWGARGGFAWYTKAGFVTDASWPSRVGHIRGGQFAGIMDREITQHLRPGPTSAVRSEPVLLDDGGVGGTGDEYHLTDDVTGRATYIFRYGTTAGRSYVGDWDGDGKDTIASRVGRTFSIRDTNDAGDPTRAIDYGRPGDKVYVGDWDGDGVDTFAVRRGSEYHVKNSVSGGAADHVIHYGRTGDDILVGDWDGDGVDTFAVRRGAEYHVKNSLSGGAADQVVHYGRPADDVYVGDWDADGRDTLTVRRDRTYYVKNAMSGGNADVVVTYGRSEDTTLVGDWNGDGTDSLGIRR